MISEGARMDNASGKKNISINRSILWIMIAGAFAAGVFLGRGSWLFDAGQAVQSAPASSTGENFSFIRPTITVAKADQRKVRELKPFRYKVTALIQEKIDNDEAAAVSVYFRDLENGNW